MASADGSAVPPFAVGLNDRQLHAVTRGPGGIIVLAGPGSGKTRVIVSRALFLHIVAKVHPSRITAVTFTNKAAGEMRDRLTASGLAAMTVCTFHRLCLRLLRRYGTAVGVSSGFTISDRSDQVPLISGILKSMGSVGLTVTKEDCLDFISHLKSKTEPLASASPPYINFVSSAGEQATAGATSPESPEDAVLASLKEMYPLTFSTLRTVYEQYQAAMKVSGKLDFDDMLVKGVELLETVPPIAAVVSGGCEHLLVDEFQDTNGLQYRLVRGMTRAHGNAFVVGDPYQCIYTWRFASPDNLNKISSDFKTWEVVILDQNYRSTAGILSVANAIITSGAPQRVEPVPDDGCDDAACSDVDPQTIVPITASLPHRKLWTSCTNAVPVTCGVFGGDESEALYIADEIKALQTDPATKGSVAVLYRTAAVSKLVEKALIKAGIAYKVTGGTRLFDHQEVKDVLAYLQFAHNPNDSIAFKRAIGAPRRGIGASTLTALENYAKGVGLPIGVAISRIVSGGISVKGVSQVAWKALGPFVHAVNSLRTAANDPRARLSDSLERVLRDIKFPEYMQKEFPADYSSRREHIAELLCCAKVFDSDSTDLSDAPPPEGSRIGHLLQHVMLLSDGEGPAPAVTAASGAGKPPPVVLSTVHAAKGQEWDTVFVIGVEASLFPHSRSMIPDEDKPAGRDSPIDEERRLLYVAVTRARRKLYITRALRRCLNGRTVCNSASPFMTSLPTEGVEIHIADDCVEVPAAGASDPPAPAEGEGTVEDPVVDESTWQARVTASGFIGQHKPTIRLPIVDCTHNPGPDFGDTLQGTIRPPSITGIIPRATFRVATEVYHADKAMGTASTSGVGGQGLQSYFSAGTTRKPDLSSTARPSCFDTPYGPVTHPTAALCVSSGHAVITGVCAPSLLPPPSTEGKEGETEGGGRAPGRRLGYRSTSGTPLNDISGSYTAATLTVGPRKPFKAPRVAAPPP